MHYCFEDFGEASCDEIARTISPLLIGHQAVNSAFDSGLIRVPEWQHINGFPVTPHITESFIAEWPVSHDLSYDEWWVFDGHIPVDFRVHSFCNFVGMQIADYKELDWEDGCPLDTYLKQFCPIAVFGNNERGYVIFKI